MPRKITKNHQKTKKNGSLTTITPATTAESTITNPTLAITITSVATAHEWLRMTSTVKFEVAVLSAFTGITGKTASKTSGHPQILGVRRKIQLLKYYHLF